MCADTSFWARSGTSTIEGLNLETVTFASGMLTETECRYAQIKKSGTGRCVVK